MAVKTRDELISALNSLLSDNTSDEAIALIEDVSDTFESFSESEDWKKKYEENDKEWRTKYKERFENKDTNDDIEVTEVTTYEDLFTVKE